MRVQPAIRFASRLTAAWAAAMLLASCACAVPTTPRQAERAVTAWLAMDGRPLGTELGDARVRDVRAYPEGSASAYYYIVELSPQGFVVVAGDDLVEPIVAFAAGGVYDPSPSNPLGALVSRDLAGRVRAVREPAYSLDSETRTRSSAAAGKWSRLLERASSLQVSIPGAMTETAICGITGPISDERVPPLVQSRWSQESVAGLACYNYYTPPGPADSSTNYPCGCVATAMAQVMRFLEYPTKGVGTKSFTIQVDGSSQPRTLRGSDGWGGPSSPTSAPTCGRTCPTVDIAGSASDSDGVTGVSWSNDRGGSGTCTGTASWSASGIPLQLGQNVITVTATDGVANTGTANLTVTYSDLRPGSLWSGTALVSLPLVPDNPDPGPSAGFVGNGWFAYDPAAGYVGYPDHKTWFEPAASTPGRGFWAFFPSGGSTAAPCGTIPPQNQPATIHLEPGWNLIGAPFVTPAKWSLTRITVRESGRAPVALRDAYYRVTDYAWGWDSSTSNYYLVCDPSVVPSAKGTLDPWLGYWIRAKKACDLILPAP